MRIYKVGPNGEVAFEGEGGGVAVRSLEALTPNLLVEILQQTFEAGAMYGLDCVLENVRVMKNGMPAEATPICRTNTRPDSQENYNRR